MLSYLLSVVQGLSQADLLFIAGAFAVGIQYVANKYGQLGSTMKWALSFPLPPFTACVTFLVAYGHVSLQQGGVAYLVAQLLYFTVEKIKALGAKSTLAEQVVL